MSPKVNEGCLIQGVDISTNEGNLYLRGKIYTIINYFKIKNNIFFIIFKPLGLL
jgi:hypothetical protein